MGTQRATSRRTRVSHQKRWDGAGRDELLKPRVREGGLVRVGEASQTLQMGESGRVVPPLPRLPRSPRFLPFQKLRP